MCIVFSRQKSEESSKDCYVLIMKQSKIQINQAQGCIWTLKLSEILN